MVGTLQFGLSRQELDLILDTGSDWLSVEGTSCTNCEGDLYSPLLSFTNERLTSTISKRSYGDVEFQGSEWTERVCITASVCVNDFEMFVVESQKGLDSSVAGIMGLARRNDLFISNAAYDVGPLYYEALFGSTQISEPTFSIYYA
jgi:hypothetical protein